jgi:hypothetical protein
MLRTLAAAFVAASMLTAPVMAENATTKAPVTQTVQTAAKAKTSAVKSVRAKSHHKSVKKVEARKHMKQVRHASKVRHVKHATHKNTHVARRAPKSSVN